MEELNEVRKPLHRRRFANDERINDLKKIVCNLKSYLVVEVLIGVVWESFGFMFQFGDVELGSCKQSMHTKFF